MLIISNIKFDLPNVQKTLLASTSHELTDENRVPRVYNPIIILINLSHGLVSVVFNIIIGGPGGA